MRQIMFQKLMLLFKHSYALSGSRLVVDLMGHFSPGGSYKLLKDWLMDLGGEPLEVPDGFILVAFDNEQRLLKNYLARGSNRSRMDVLTNVCCAVVDSESDITLMQPCIHHHGLKYHVNSWLIRLLFQIS